MPDPAEPVAVQLEKAVRRLKEQALRCSNLQSQCDLFEKVNLLLKFTQRPYSFLQIANVATISYVTLFMLDTT